MTELSSMENSYMVMREAKGLAYKLTFSVIQSASDGKSGYSWITKILHTFGKDQFKDVPVLLTNHL